jgi:hypothetical protein
VPTIGGHTDQRSSVLSRLASRGWRVCEKRSGDPALRGFWIPPHGVGFTVLPVALYSVDPGEAVSDKVSKTVPVKFDELREAFEFANVDGGVSDLAAYVSLETGKIYFVSGQEDLDEEIPDDIEESVDYLAVPDRSILSLGSRLVFQFVRSEMPDDHDTVAGIFARKGAYRRFKDFIDSKGKLDRWYEFEANATDEALRGWCRDNGIELIES